MSRDDKFERIYISMQKANQILKKTFDKDSPFKKKKNSEICIEKPFSPSSTGRGRLCSGTNEAESLNMNIICFEFGTRSPKHYMVTKLDIGLFLRVEA